MVYRQALLDHTRIGTVFQTQRHYLLQCGYVGTPTTAIEGGQAKEPLSYKAKLVGELPEAYA